MRRVNHVLHLIAVAVPAALYAVSMWLPVNYGINKSCSRAPGWAVFEQGWSYATGPVALRLKWWCICHDTSWLANPVFWIALIALIFSRPRIAAVAAGLATALSMRILLDEWEDMLRSPGYWFWWGSMVTAIFSAWFLMKQTPLPAQADDYGPMKIPEQKQ